MIRIDLTLPDPLANIAFDEALLEHAESRAAADPPHPELLRLWEPRVPLVVLGRSSPYLQEVNHDFCRAAEIPVVRRCSGGQSVVTGPGCLMYAVLLDYRRRPELRMLDTAHQFVMTRMQQALASIGILTEISGTSDLTIGGRKVSGNSLRCKRNWMIYHGTMICELEIELIANCLGDPIRQPNYRSQRSHQDFLVQLKTPVATLKEAIAASWAASFAEYDWPRSLTQSLVKTKYALDQWNQKV